MIPDNVDLSYDLYNLMYTLYKLELTNYKSYGYRDCHYTVGSWLIKGLIGCQKSHIHQK